MGSLTFLVPLHHLRFQPNLPAGMNPLRVCAIADRLRNVGGEVDVPVLVERLNEDDWIVRDGRHRVVASWIAGRSTVLCQEQA
jgi:hypothetical protein